MPTSYAQMGYKWGVFFQLFYATVGIFTCYLLARLYVEYRARREREGVDFSKHVIQYHEVLGSLVGVWAERASLFFNIVTVGALSVVQIIACARTRGHGHLVFGAASTLVVFLPTIHNYRIWSFMGVLTTTYTAWFMFISALIHGQALQTFFLPRVVTPLPYELLHKNNAFAVFHSSHARSTAIVFMILHQAVATGLFSMPLMFLWEKLWGLHYSHYLVRTACRVPVALTLWLLALAFPFFGPLNSMIGALFMSFSVFIIPCVAYIITIWTPEARQNEAERPSKFRKLISWWGLVIISSLVVVIVATLGSGLGSYASVENIIRQIRSFGVFDKCYQC